MKFTLIGGGGFIGQQLAIHLSMDHEVVVIDNFCYDQNDDLGAEVRVIKDDVMNITRHESELKTSDYVFFMASPRLNEINDLPQPLPYIDALSKTLEICDDEDLKTQVIFFSSCSVYGYQKGIMNEFSQTKVTSLYSKLKIDSENVLKKFGNDRFKIIRLSTLFGLSRVPRNDLLINNFVKDVLFSKYLEVYDPQAWRPNINIFTLIDVLKELAEGDKFERILNIGFNELNITKQDLILTLVTQNKLDFAVKYYAPSDSRSYRVNFSRLESLIENTEPISYSAGVDQLIDGFKKELSNHYEE